MRGFPWLDDAWHLQGASAKNSNSCIHNKKEIKTIDVNLEWYVNALHYLN